MRKPHPELAGGFDLTIERLDFATLIAIVIALLLSVAFYASVDAWAEMTTVFLIAIAAALRLTSALASPDGSFFRRGEPIMLALLAAIPALALCQLYLFPSLGLGTIDAYATQRFAVMFTALIVAFDVFAFVAKSVAGYRLLVCGVLLAAGISSVFGLVRSGLEEWGVDVVNDLFRPGLGFAQFVNRNHFLFLLEMGAGLCCGLVLQGGLERGPRFFGVLGIAASCALALAANSRGGLFSIVAMLVFAAVGNLFIGDGHSRGRAGRRAGALKGVFAVLAGAVVIGTAIFFVAWAGGDRVVSRFEKIEGEIETRETGGINRWLMWKSTTTMIAARPLTGWGFGGYGRAVTAYDESAGRYGLEQAHNDYLEIAANGGAVAVLLVVGLFGLVLRRTIGRLRGERVFEKGSAFGGLLAMVGVLVHSTVDFGLHAMGNALVFMAIIVIASFSPEDSETSVGVSR